MFAVLSNRLSSLPKLSKTCYLLLIFSFMECAAGGIAYYLSLYLGTATTLSKLQIGEIGSIIGVGSLSGALLATYITDTLNSKSIIVLSFIFLSLGFFCLPQSMNFIAISVCAFIIGIATSTFLTANNTLLLQSAPQDPDSLRIVQSMKVVSENLGNSCSIALIMFFAAQYYDQIFQGIGIFFLFFAVNALKYLNGVEILKHQTVIKTDSPNEISNKKQLYRTVSALFIVGIIYAQQRVAYPLFLNDTFASFTITAALFWLDPVIVSLFQLKVTRLVAPLKIHHQLALGGLLLGSGLCALLLVHTIVGAVLCCLTFILGEMIFMPLSFVHCYEAAGIKSKGMATGAWRSAYAAGLIFGPTLSGLLMSHYSYNACWILAGILGLLLLILFAIYE